MAQRLLPLSRRCVNTKQHDIAGLCVGKHAAVTQPRKRVQEPARAAEKHRHADGFLGERSRLFPVAFQRANKRVDRRFQIVLPPTS
jgi:hypothetical protein